MQTEDMEELAGMSIEQIEEKAASNSNHDDHEDVEAAGDDLQAGEQAVKEGAATGAAEDGGQEEKGVFVETKSGNGRIPYKELAETRERLSEANKKIEQLERRSYKADVPEDFQSQMEAVSAERMGLKGQFENGDISFEEYEEKVQAIIERREELLKASVKAEISQEMRQQQAVETWEQTVNNFLDTPVDGIDYRADQEKFDALDRYVKILAADPENNDKDQKWFLAEAHAIVKVRSGSIDVSNKQKSPPNTSPAKADGYEEARPAFQTLSDIPGGTPPAKDLAEQIGELSGAALTNRFLNDPASIEKYLASLG